MSYSDEYHDSGSKIYYDGALLPAEDVLARYERDEKIEEKYLEAEKQVDADQMTWDDVEEKLSKNDLFHDPRAGNVGAKKPGGSRF